MRKTLGVAHSPTLPLSHTAVPQLVPIVRELPADLETPVSVYLRLAGHGPSFLLESVTGGENVARYSFIGVNPRQAFVLRGRTVERHAPGGVTQETLPPNTNPLGTLRDELNRYAPVTVPGLPRFVGGLVGYLGYEMMRFFESVLKLDPRPDLPDAIFLQADTLVAFDHAYGRLLLIANAAVDGDEAAAGAAAAPMPKLGWTTSNAGWRGRSPQRIPHLGPNPLTPRCART